MADEIELNIETGEEVLKNSAPEDEHLDQPEGVKEEGDEDRPLNTDNASDEELNNAEDDEEREAIRERRRQERKHRKEAQREREDTLRRELASRDAVINELRGKVDLIERRNTGSELAQVDNAIQQAQSAYAFFKNQIQVATEAQNGAAVADATENLFKSQRKIEELNGLKNAFSQRQAQPQPLDPRMKTHAEGWMKRNSWYDPTGRDQDSEIAMRLDQRMAQEGWDPTTAEYWTELDSRVKKYLPHRATSGKIPSNKPRSVVTGSGRESSGNGSSTTYKLSADRVSALKEAGMWDDPKKRAEAIKRFRDYDKQNKA